MKPIPILMGAGFLCAVCPGLAVTQPTFAGRQDILGLFTQAIAIGDVNGDGNPDIVASAGGALYVLLGNGRGGFEVTPLQQTNGGGGFGDIVLEDLNGDGKLDVVIPAENPRVAYKSAVTVCLGNGDGTFQYGNVYAMGTDDSNTAPVVGDFDGDGKLDVIIGGSSGLWFFHGNGDGTLKPGVEVATYTQESESALAAGDLNGDGKLDVVVGFGYYNTHGFAVYFGNGNGTFKTPVPFGYPKLPQAIAVAPLRPGGPPAIITTDAATQYAWIYQGDGKGDFGKPRYASLGNSVGARGLAVGDVNGDGYTDLASATGNVAYGNGYGGFPKSAAFPVLNGGTQYAVAFGDLLNRGVLDMVVDSQLAISILLNKGHGQFLDGNVTPVTGGADCGVSDDFNRDGKPDLAVNNAAGVTILLGTGSVAKPLVTGASMPLAGAGCPVLGDVNGDGIVDLTVGSPAGATAFLGHGDGTFTQGALTTLPSEGQIVLADFNHDGKLDLASSANVFAYGNGDGTYGALQQIAITVPPGGFSAIAAGDVNNDGWPDIVLVNTALNPYVNTYVLLNDQHGGFTQMITNFGEFADQVTIVDINGDGNPDIVESIVGGGSALVYLGDGTGNFTQAYNTSGGDGPGNNTVADLNGDGILDLAILGGNTVGVLAGMGDGTFNPQTDVGAGPAPAWVLLANLHGQSASEGKPDLVVPDASGNVLVLFNTTK